VEWCVDRHILETRLPSPVLWGASKLAPPSFVLTAQRRKKRLSCEKPGHPIIKPIAHIFLPLLEQKIQSL
jgi:hypothetical protein